MHNVNKVLDSQLNCRITKKSSWTLFLCQSGKVKSLYTSFKSKYFILTKQVFFCEITRQALLLLHVNDQLVINCNDSRRPCIMLAIV